MKTGKQVNNDEILSIKFQSVEKEPNLNDDVEGSQINEIVCNEGDCLACPEKCGAVVASRQEPQLTYF